MNTYVERIELLPFALWDGLQVSILQSVLLLVIAAGWGYWFLEKSKTGFKYGLAALLLFIVLRSVSFIQAGNRQQVVIYNVPQKQAIDFIHGRNYFFAGDSDLLADDFIRNFHIKPSRILHRTEPAEILPVYNRQDNLVSFGNKKFVIINETNRFSTAAEAQPVDLLIVSGNPKLYFNQLSKALTVKQVVFDGSCPPWKIKYWKKDCDSLHIPYHDVNEKGAFVFRVK
jgi:competence protein ComEC